MVRHWHTVISHWCENEFDPLHSVWKYCNELGLCCSMSRFLKVQILICNYLNTVGCHLPRPKKQSCCDIGSHKLLVVIHICILPVSFIILSNLCLSQTRKSSTFSPGLLQFSRNSKLYTLKSNLLHSTFDSKCVSPRTGSLPRKMAWWLQTFSAFCRIRSYATWGTRPLSHMLVLLSRKKMAYE